MPLPKPIEWWLDNKWLVAILSLLILGGSLAITRLSEQNDPTAPPSPEGPGFEAPPKAKLPKLKRAAVESLVVGPADKAAKTPAPGAAEETDGAKDPGRRAATPEPEALAVPDASALLPKPPGGKLEKLSPFGKGEGSGGGGGGYSGRGGGERAAAEETERRATQASGSGAGAFVRRQFANAGRRMAKLIGGGATSKQFGRPGGNAVPPPGVADNARAAKAELGIGGGTSITGAGATSPEDPRAPGPSAPAVSRGSTGGGGGRQQAHAPKPSPSPTPTPKHGPKKDKKAKKEQAAGTADSDDPCSKGKPTTRCAILTCLDKLEIWRLSPELAREFHAAEPRVGAAEPRVGAAEPRVGAAESSKPGALILPHYQRILQQATSAQAAIDALYQEANALVFDCEECEAMAACPAAAAAAIKPALDKANEIVSGERPRSKLSAALRSCASVPFEHDQDGRLCKRDGDDAKAADVDFAGLVRNMSKAADCPADGPPEALAAWNQWAERVRQKVAELSKTFDKPWCPDRTKCTPPAQAEAVLKKMDEGTAKASIFQEDLPSAVPYLVQAHTDNGEAIAALPKAPTDEGALRELVYANDRAAHQVDLARKKYLAEKAQACVHSPAAGGAGGAGGGRSDGDDRDRPLR